MKKLSEQYNYEKFWSCFLAHDRNVSAWDEHRTDQDVFIRRTLAKWFEGKYLAILFEKYVPADGIWPLAWREAYTVKYMKYVAVWAVRFAYSWSSGEILVRYDEPHSLKIETMRLKKNDCNRMWIEEDKESWTVLKKFYPTEKNKIALPQI